MYMHLVFAFIIMYVCMYMYYSMQAYTKLDQGQDTDTINIALYTLYM